MAKQVTDLSAVTTVESGDILWLTRTSLGAAGSKKITVEDFENTLASLIDKYVYAIGGMMLEPQPANAVILIHVPSETIVIPSTGNRSCGKALTAATGSTTFSIRKNGVEFGTMNVGVGSTVPSFNFPSDTTLVGGTDYLTVINPASPDITLALFGFTIWGRR
jgi:hypothetical protein